MKRASRIILLISAAVFALGVMMTGASLISGGRLEHIREAAGASDHYVNYADEDVHSIVVDIPVGNVIFRPGNDLGVVALGAAKAYFSCEAEGGVLRIEEKWPGAKNIAAARALAAAENWPQLVIFVPQEFSDGGGSVSATVKLGSCHVEGLGASDFDLDVLSGLINLSVPGGFADYDISGRVGIGKYTSGGHWVFGSYKIINGNAAAASKLDFRCAAGEVILNAAG